MSDLEESFVLREDGPYRWRAVADSRYEATNSMFGGWTAAVALRSMSASAEDGLLPSSLHVNFARMIEPGTEILIEVFKFAQSRSIQHWRAELTSARGNRPLAMASAVLSSRRPSPGHVEPLMPSVPEPESLELIHPPGTYGQRTIRRPVDGYPPFLRGSTTSRDWVRDTTGRKIDHFQLAFLSDSYTPRTVFWSESRRRTATISLSVHFVGTPDEIDAIGDDYVLNEAIESRSSYSTSGQQARLWRRDGVLLATTEQMHWYS